MEKFFVNKINRENIEVIYTIHPLEGENDIFEECLIKNVIQKKKSAKY